MASWFMDQYSVTEPHQLGSNFKQNMYTCEGRAHHVLKPQMSKPSSAIWSLTFVWLAERPYTARQPKEWPALNRMLGSLRQFLCPQSPMVTPEGKVPSSAKGVMQRGTGWTMDLLLEACGKGGC